MSVPVFHDPVFSEHVSPGHPERPARVEAIVTHLRGLGDLDLAWRGAPDATTEELELVHDPRHITHIAALSERGGAWIDPDTYCTARSYAVALRSAGAAIAAVDAVCTDPDTPQAWSLGRPPGHHATPTTAMGFCLFNNVAAAIAVARSRHGVERVAVVDIDVHHGNGTQDIFWNDRDVLYTSLHRYPFYPGTGAASERGGEDADAATINVPYRAGTGGAAWLEAFDATVLPALREHAPELVVVSAGFDAHAADPLGDAGLDESTYAAVGERLGEVAAEHASGRVAWVLEGGYDLGALAASVEAILRTSGATLHG